MHLIIQIPCLNEEKTLPSVLRELPKKIVGIDKIEVLIIDDGSTDRTVEVARSSGAHHVVSLGKNRGLARAFSVGIENCLKLGADIIVNTDADNQYQGEYIARLIDSILKKESDIVVGCRPIEEIQEFSWIKKKLQRLGSWVVRKLSNTDVSDVTSGFRAYSRHAAFRINVVSRFTYTLETLIQSGQRGLKIGTVPIQVNPATRESRLARGTFNYVLRSLGTLVLISTQFRPLWTFLTVGVASILLGLIPSIRFLIVYFQGPSSGHIQSLVLSAVMILFGTTSCLIGLLADQVAGNRRLLEEANAYAREIRYGAK